MAKDTGKNGEGNKTADKKATPAKVSANTKRDDSRVGGVRAAGRGYE